MSKGELGAARIGEAIVADAASSGGVLKFRLARQAGDPPVSVAGCPETLEIVECPD